MIAFAHIPKTAGTTLTAILRRNFGWRHFDTRGVTGKGLMHADELRGVQRLYPRLASIAGHGVSPAGDMHDVCEMRYYTFVRNPIERCLSHFQFALACRAKRGDAAKDPLAYFHEFIVQHRNWHTRQIAGEENAAKAIALMEQRVSFVGLVEEFDESLVMFRAWSEMPSLDIRYRALNVSAGRKVKDQFLLRERMQNDPALAAVMEGANREDLELYGWVKGEVYPRQRLLYEAVLSHELAAFRKSNANTKHCGSDSLAARAYRNAIFKPLRRFILPQRAA